MHERLKRLRAARGRAPVLGMAKARAADVFSAPERPKRSPMPLCHASTPEMWRAFREGWRRFERAYRLASELFRGGHLSATFPDFTFRPPSPLLA